MLLIITLICIASMYMIINTICTYSKPSTSMIQRHNAVNEYWSQYSSSKKDTGIVRYSKPRHKDTTFIVLINTNSCYSVVAQRGE
jgi:hypothetical protein